MPWMVISVSYDVMLLFFLYLFPDFIFCITFRTSIAKADYVIMKVTRKKFSFSFLDKCYIWSHMILYFPIILITNSVIIEQKVSI